MAETYYIKTFGCQMNEHDSQRLTAILEEEGYTAARLPGEADLVLLNTCSVRHNPENKVYSLLGALRPIKRNRPSMIVGVAGCVAQQEGERILEREKCVDLVFGPDNFFRLPEMIAEVKSGKRVCETKWMSRDKKVQNFIPDEWVERGHTDGVKAYVAITKGCNNLCSFCVVPHTRGREVSREKDNVVREVRSLLAAGAKEIWLLGQNVNSYRPSPDYGFLELLDELSALEGLCRIRFTSPHPKDWSNALTDLMAARKNICNQLHLPFQAGSDRILQAMRRNHTLEDYLDKVRYLQARIPNIELSTDLIVGYPDETESDFERTLYALETARFGQVFSFKYSPRPGTKAAEIEDDVPREVKEERLARVIALQHRINEEQLEACHGTVQEVLIDGAHPRQRGMMNGRTEGYRPISAHAPHLEVGDLIPLRVTGHQGHWLLGECIEP